MSWTEQSTGSVVNDGSEDNLASALTAAGTYVAYLDLNSMASGDRIEGRVYVKAYSGGTERLFYGPGDGLYWVDAPEDKMAAFPVVSIPVSGSVRYTVTQVAGTNRTLPYTILSQ